MRVQQMPSLRTFCLTAITGICLAASSGCASHRPPTCKVPARVFGDYARNNQGAWIVVRPGKSVEDTAERIATSYHVRTQPLRYTDGFTIFPVEPDTFAKLRCDKAVLEFHYDIPSTTASR